MDETSTPLARRTHGALRVTVERPRGGPGSVTREAYATAPLRLLRPRNHGHAQWLFPTLLGPGLLGGDELSVEVSVGPGAACYAGSLGVTRAFAGASRLTQRLSVAAGGLLVWAPEPLACGPGADLTQQTLVTLEEGASLLLVDALCEGRPALGERWAFERLRSLLTVTVAGHTRLREQLDLRPRELPVARHFGPFGAMALLCAVGPRASAARQAWASHRPDKGPARLAHGAALGDDGALLRLAAPDATALAAEATAALGDLDALLGDDPRRRRF